MNAESEIGSSEIKGFVGVWKTYGLGVSDQSFHILRVSLSCCIGRKDSWTLEAILLEQCVSKRGLSSFLLALFHMNKVLKVMGKRGSIDCALSFRHSSAAVAIGEAEAECNNDEQ
jgi:hypothetical protein